MKISTFNIVAYLLISFANGYILRGVLEARQDRLKIEADLNNLESEINARSFRQKVRTYSRDLAASEKAAFVNLEDEWTDEDYRRGWKMGVSPELYAESRK